MNEELMNRLSEEIRQKLAACKTRDEIRKVLAEAGVEPLDDEDLAVVAGGSRGPVQGRVVYNNE
ncbi:MAG: hypothetical protein IKO91_07480 [Oscillospiraceae bacterium]|nr:hypothetical protein [Oscillospiraceae bacterium]